MGLCDSGQNGPGWWGTGSHRRPGAWHEGPCALQASAGSGERHFCPVPAGSAQGCPELVTGAGSGARPLSAGLCVWCVPASCGRCNKVPQTGRLTRHDGLPVWCQKSEIEEPAGLARPGGPEGAPSGFCGSGGPSARGHRERGGGSRTCWAWPHEGVGGAWQTSSLVLWGPGSPPPAAWAPHWCFHCREAASLRAAPSTPPGGPEPVRAGQAPPSESLRRQVRGRRQSLTSAPGRWARGRLKTWWNQAVWSPGCSL